MHFIRNSALSGLAAIHLAAAQTYTTCNPTEKTCPNDTGLNSASFACDFTQGKSALASWSTAAGTTITYDDTKGAGFTINGKNQAPTISTDFYIFFGKVEVTMQAAPGTGIVSSMVLQSEDLDEIDWEWLGGDTTQAQTNYFGKGNTTSYDRGTYQSVSSPQTGMHTYAFDWSPSKVSPFSMQTTRLIRLTILSRRSTGLLMVSLSAPSTMPMLLEVKTSPRLPCASSWAIGLRVTQQLTLLVPSCGQAAIRTSQRLLSSCT
jgi:hypothetical protein